MRDFLDTEDGKIVVFSENIVSFYEFSKARGGKSFRAYGEQINFDFLKHPIIVIDFEIIKYSLPETRAKANDVFDALLPHLTPNHLFVIVEPRFFFTDNLAFETKFYEAKKNVQFSLMTVSQD